MSVAGLGGTFNVLHLGHRVLIDKAFEVADSVTIGLTSDSYASKTKRFIVPLEKRMAALEDYLGTKSKPWTIVVIEDELGNATTNRDLSDLVVSEGTLENAEKINHIRWKNGMRAMRLHVVPHVLADDFVPISSSRVLAGEIDLQGNLKRPLRVSIGSGSEIKLNAVYNVLSRIYEGVDVSSCPVSSEVRDQPWEEETIMGAAERARKAIGNADLGIGIEAGVWPKDQGLFDIQFCAIIDRMGRITIGQGSGFQYPPEVEKSVVSGSSVGDAFKHLYGWDKKERTEGAIGFLSRGLMTRTELTEQAVLAAMIPRIRKELYFESRSA